MRSRWISRSHREMQRRGYRRRLMRGQTVKRDALRRQPALRLPLDLEVHHVLRPRDRPVVPLERVAGVFRGGRP